LEKIKVTYIVSNIDKAVAFEWISDQIDRSKFELSFIILNSSDSYLYQWLQKRGLESYLIQHQGKKSYLSSFLKIVRLLLRIKSNVVHTHLFDANLIGLTAAKLLGIKKRIYTRHHSTYHHDNFPQAVKYDKWSNKMATQIVAITENVKNVLIEKEAVLNEKIRLIHHGFDLERFQNVSQSDIKDLRQEYKLEQDNFPVVGVVSRYITWKGIQYIIPAFKQILKENPCAKLVLANATGPDANFIKEELKQLPKGSYIEIVFEPNLFALYYLFDIYIHVPTDSHIEAFGQTYVEALAAGVPCVFTLSGVANEFIKDKENALVVAYKNSAEIFTALQFLLSSEPLRQKLITNGRESVKQFNLDLFIHKLEDLYE